MRYNQKFDNIKTTRSYMTIREILVQHKERIFH